MVFFDESSFQNEPYTRKSLYKSGTKHTLDVNPYKFKVNATGSLAINGNSTITLTNSSTAPEIGIALIELRKANLSNEYNKILLENILNNVNYSDSEIDKYLMENAENNNIFVEKLHNTLEKYKDETTTDIARIVEKHCKRESLNNIKKRREIKRNLMNKELENNDIESVLSNEKTIYLILDNYSVHKSVFIKNIANILNICLIYLPPYSPHLNPIEQLWKMMKNRIKKYFLESKEYLEGLTKKTFFESINDSDIYKNWEEEFIPKVW